MGLLEQLWGNDVLVFLLELLVVTPQRQLPDARLGEHLLVLVEPSLVALALGRRLAVDVDEGQELPQ